MQQTEYKQQKTDIINSAATANDVDLDEVQSERYVNQFIGIISRPHWENIDVELMRDILTFSKLYDRNYDRMHKAIVDGDTVAEASFRRIEYCLFRIGQVLRERAGL